MKLITRALCSIMFMASCSQNRLATSKIEKKMDNDLKSEIIGSTNAPVVVLFGGSPIRRQEVVELLGSIGDITVYGTLGEEEGMAKIEALNRKVDLVLIGGRYTPEQRTRIKKWIATNMLQTKVTQPGYDYPYSNESILNDVKLKLEL